MDDIKRSDITQLDMTSNWNQLRCEVIDRIMHLNLKVKRTIAFAHAENNYD